MGERRGITIKIAEEESSKGRRIRRRKERLCEKMEKKGVGALLALPNRDFLTPSSCVVQCWLDVTSHLYNHVAASCSILILCSFPLSISSFLSFVFFFLSSVSFCVIVDLYHLTVCESHSSREGERAVSAEYCATATSQRGNGRRCDGKERGGKFQGPLHTDCNDQK